MAVYSKNEVLMGVNGTKMLRGNSVTIVDKQCIKDFRFFFPEIIQFSPKYTH